MARGLKMLLANESKLALFEIGILGSVAVHSDVLLKEYEVAMR